MSEADRLRDEAARALRLSELIADEQTRKALAALAADLLKRAEAIERENMDPAPQPPVLPEQPSQQQQEQKQPKDADGPGDC